ncbi:MAG TPA: DUF4421 domain-containing protein, partial [Chitinophagaceae bacterium]|nr:DUF4421 domain-containing protein [Chitinophagaceae bacterium]
MKKFRLRVICYPVLVILFSTQPLEMRAQKNNGAVQNDPVYYEKVNDRLTLRLLLSQKFSHFTIPSDGTVDDIQYRANTKLNLGVGFSYMGIGFNVGYGFKFLNNDNDKGKTKGLNLQIHLFPRKWAIDLLVMRPEGFYIHPKGYGSINQMSYYYRDDISIHAYGISAYQVTNKKQFSYKAAISQTEWQKRSAGTWLYGAEAYYVSIAGDEPLVPLTLIGGFPQDDIDELTAFTVGIGAGAAYTLVIDKHFFIMGSAVGNLDFTSLTEETDNAKTKKSSISPVVIFKSAIGYGNENWNLSANMLGSAFWFRGASSAKSYFMPVSQMRLVLAKRFNLK